MSIQKRKAVYLDGETYPVWMNYLFLLLWLAAAVSVFIPFARDTSAWNAVTLKVPGDQGNWWHVLVGAPFFLAYPMVWLRLRYLLSRQLLTPRQTRLVWSAVGLSVCATTLVQIPFLLHLAGTSEWQRLLVLFVGFGIMLASALTLYFRWSRVAPTQRCVIGLNAAYISNAALCLVVYSEAKGSTWSRAGWLLTVVIVWPIALELLWLLLRHSHKPASQITSNFATQ